MGRELEIEITCIANERGLDCMDPKVRRQIRAELRPLWWYLLRPFTWTWSMLTWFIAVRRCFLNGCWGDYQPTGTPTGGDYDWIDVTRKCPRCGKVSKRRFNR